MSRRTKLYRDRMGKTESETRDTILRRHRYAVGKKSGKTCSYGMDMEKAARIADRLHKK